MSNLDQFRDNIEIAIKELCPTIKDDTLSIILENISMLVVESISEDRIEVKSFHVDFLWTCPFCEKENKANEYKGTCKNCGLCVEINPMMLDY